jgi:hypothetical protein
VLPFPCPDFVCPYDLLEHGYPWVELLDVGQYARARNGFSPVQFAQFPPPGSILRFGTTRGVHLTATDADNRSLSCTTSVTVPQVVLCGTVQMNVTAGSYRQVGEFQPSDGVLAGTLYKMKGILQSRLTGKGSVIARLRKGGDKFTGSIAFKGNRTKGAINNLMIPSPFTKRNASDALVVDLTVSNNTNPGTNVVRYDVFCELSRTVG